MAYLSPVRKPRLSARRIKQVFLRRNGIRQRAHVRLTESRPVAECWLDKIRLAERIDIDFELEEKQRHHFGIDFRDVRHVHREALGAQRKRRQRTQEWLVILIVLSRHGESDKAYIGTQSIVGFKPAQQTAA